MYIDQADDNDAARVSDLKEVNNSGCQRLNQKVWNIENSCHSNFFQTRSEYLKCHRGDAGSCCLWTSSASEVVEGRGGDHFVNQLLSLISLEKLLRSCQPELGALLLLITSAIYDVCSFSSVTVSKTPRLSEMMQILPAKDFSHSCKGPESELLR